jgi:Kef-type K+ transport system membrane component KefB
MNTSLQILICVALIIMLAKLAGAVTARFGLPLVLGEQMTSGGVMSWRALAMTLTKMAVCLAALFWIGPPVTRWILKQAGRLHGHHTEVAAALIIAFLLAFQVEWLGGMAGITGAYLGGLDGRFAFFFLLLLIAVVGKIVGCGAGALLSGFTRRVSLVVGVGMIPRGEVGLITASLG